MSYLICLTLTNMYGVLWYNFFLYIAVVFDEWKQGIPIAFIIQEKSHEVDIVSWLRKLNARC